MSIATSHDEIQASLEYLKEAARSQGQGDELVAVLIRESADLLKKRQPRGGGLTAEQAAYLIESGDFDEGELAETEREVAAGVLADEERETRLGAVARSLGSGEVAERLGIDVSRVRHRRGSGLLYGFLVGGKRRYPTWQFIPETNLAIPQMATVIEAFPKDWHPAGVEAFMTSPKSSLLAKVTQTGAVGAGQMTPVEWLLDGRDPQAVVSILDSFLQS